MDDSSPVLRGRRAVQARNFSRSAEGDLAPLAAPHPRPLHPPPTATQLAADAPGALGSSSCAIEGSWRGADVLAPPSWRSASPRSTPITRSARVTATSFSTARGTAPTTFERVDDTWSPQTVRAGRQLWALLPPTAVVGQMNLRRRVALWKERGITLDVFTEMEKAFDWRASTESSFPFPRAESAPLLQQEL